MLFGLLNLSWSELLNTLECMFILLILLKNHINTIKTKLQTKIKKKKVSNFLQKNIFCAEFLALQNIKIWRWRFFGIQSYEPKQDVKLKKKALFLQ